LRTQCPNFFRDADRVRMKGLEYLRMASMSDDSSEVRKQFLDKSLKFFLSVSYEPSPIDTICEEYQKLRFFHGIIRLALSYAHSFDPNGLALSWHKRGRPPSDVAGRKAFDVRMQYYACITNIFDALKPQVISTATSTKETMTNAFDQALQISFSSEDELFHYMLYQWFLDNQLEMKLINSHTPFLESFFNSIKGGWALLWQYFLANKKFVRSAEVLVKLAESKQENLTLFERVENLSRAKNCLEQQGSEVSVKLMLELQEKIEVAQVQMKIYRELSQRADRDEELRDSLRQLDGELFNISDLYNKFASKFHLWEAMLDILHCTGYNDPSLVRNLWSCIADSELKHGVFTPLKDKVKLLGKEYFPSESVFPTGFLIDMLESKGSVLRGTASDWDLKWLFHTMLDIGIPYSQLYDCYNSLLDSKSTYWQSGEGKLHLLQLLYYLIDEWISFMRTPGSSASFEKSQFELKGVRNSISKYVVILEGTFRGNPDAIHLRNSFKIFQSEHLI